MKVSLARKSYDNITAVIIGFDNLKNKFPDDLNTKSIPIFKPSVTDFKPLNEKI